MKKFLSILLLMSLLFTMFASVGHAAGTPPKLFLNGKELHSDVEPKIVNGSTLVPLAILSEGLGYEVEWEPETKKVTVKNEMTVIELVINQSSVRVNGVVMETDAKPQLMNWRTMVPVRLVGELLGLSFEWKEAAREVHMFEKSTEPDPETPVVGYITAVTMDEQSVIRIAHAGASAPGKPMVLDNPRRLVFNFPYTTFIPQIADQFVGGQTETLVADNPLLTAYRYSQFSTQPLTARLVIVVGNDTGYVVTSGDNEISIALMPKAEVPTEPAEPEMPVDPKPTPPPVENPEVYDIVLDAGHGAKDPGAYSKPLNKWEKEFNLSAVLKVKAELEKDPRFKVHLTRKDDTFVELLDRVKFAESVKADIFISIHANSYDNTSVSGVETYYERANSKPLADIIHKHVLAGMGLRDRGVKKAAFKVIKETTMPAILIEAGYLTNTTDANALFNAKTQDKLAVEIVKGIKTYLKLK
ncbi:N-acetylmuramoyl-L-alanine amidase [Paenibacillus sp. LHD-117]|uniref:N-acetylmuramoyl-L-alanine amidase n=1 Tax=Paenibacillus sp. LHD-117 TaxID=3071412 RepID=UPI0027E05649|nr:N-acetylmuramoyl-L-alanine amidase [Paenibacillus sp. LHD-117]MDQ6418171.1 N-acetylmuramoyl-L-alanine amidase [Paenibacillus sp. LHD-117]